VRMHAMCIIVVRFCKSPFRDVRNALYN